MSAFDSFAKTDWGQTGNDILAGNGIAGRSSTADGAPINGNNAGMGTSTTASNPTMIPGVEGIMGMSNGNPTNDNTATSSVMTQPVNYLAKGMGAAGGAATGAQLGSFAGPWGTGIGAVVGGLLGAFGG